MEIDLNDIIEYDYVLNILKYYESAKYILTSAKPIAHSLSFMKFLGSVSLSWSTFLAILTISSLFSGTFASTLSKIGFVLDGRKLRNFANIS